MNKIYLSILTLFTFIGVCYSQTPYTFNGKVISKGGFVGDASNLVNFPKTTLTQPANGLLQVAESEYMTIQNEFIPALNSEFFLVNATIGVLMPYASLSLSTNGIVVYKAPHSPGSYRVAVDYEHSAFGGLTSFVGTVSIEYLNPSYMYSLSLLDGTDYECYVAGRPPISPWNCPTTVAQPIANTYVTRSYETPVGSDNERIILEFTTDVGFTNIFITAFFTPVRDIVNLMADPDAVASGYPPRIKQISIEKISSLPDFVFDAPQNNDDPGVSGQMTVSDDGFFIYNSRSAKWLKITGTEDW